MLYVNDKKEFEHAIKDGLEFLMDSKQEKYMLIHILEKMMHAKFVLVAEMRCN